jgi:hypothetical protein
MIDVIVDYPCLKKATKSSNVVPVMIDVIVDYPCLKKATKSSNVVPTEFAQVFSRCDNRLSVFEKGY